MNILIAADSFKDCLDAKAVGSFLKDGLDKAGTVYNIKIIPMADGGEGTVRSLIDATNGNMQYCVVKDPLMRDVNAHYGILGDKKTAVIEMASASGIELLNVEERNPWVTTTFGTGQLICSALDNGCKRIILGIGGSATNDGGVGMAMALGVKFLNKVGEGIGIGGGALSNLDSIDISEIDSRILDCEIIVACDVSNPLIGPEGASYVYGPQKGANEEMVRELDSNLDNLAQIISSTLNIEVAELPGAGAAGGLGAGLVAFCSGKLERGFSIVAKETNLNEHCKWADIVITGEGKIDSQTKYGKTPQGVANIAKDNGAAVFAVAGTLGEGYTELYKSGFDVIFSIVDKPMELKDALANADKLLTKAGQMIGNILLLNKKLHI